MGSQFPPRLTLNAETRKEIPKQIRAALEEHGCFVLNCEKGRYFSEEMMVAAENFFTLDSEAKAKNVKLDLAFTGHEAINVLNGRAIDEEAENFTRLLWPDGNQKFCQTLNSTAKGLLELSEIIMDIVIASYGLDHDEAMSRFLNAHCSMRMLKYRAREKGEEGMVLPEHVDGTYISILSQNEVDGIKIKSKEGNWLDVHLEEGSFLVFAGEMLQAWSNGRLLATAHKVVMSGAKDRYTLGFFLAPLGDEVVQASYELVDNQNPARYKPFVYKDFYAYSLLEGCVEGTLGKFAGI